MSKKSDVQKVEVRFETKGAVANGVISGVNPEVLRQPDKIKQLMDLLELPKGTDARLLFTTSDVIVR